MASRSIRASSELRLREESAARLATAAPGLASLRIALDERSTTSSARYDKHVAVGTSPAVFVIGCSDERCQGGGHDITAQVMSALAARQTHRVGDHVCEGSTGEAPCQRHLHYEIFARYQPAN